MNTSLLESITQTIGTIGFPIVAYLLIFFKLEKAVNRLKSTLQSLVTELAKNPKDMNNK